jgi:hypothetical protein
MQNDKIDITGRIDWLLGLTWLLVTISAAVLAIEVVGLMSLLNVSEDWSLFIVPIFFAMLQWLVLRYALGVSAWWILATIVGLAAAGLGLLTGALVIGFGSADRTFLYSLAIGGALLLGGLQSIVLGRKLPGAGWWLVPTLVSIVGLLVLSAGPLADLDFIAAATGLVTLYGLLTGLTLVLLARRQPAARPVPARLAFAALALTVLSLLIYLVLG